MRDILLFLSDQHSPLYSAFAGGRARTPFLDLLCCEGTSYDACYTPCPLCVPARMALLSGQLPSRTGVLCNLDTLPDMTPTFLHPFVAAGYETVLVGRMHFVGQDQRHGFTRRIAADMTPVTWNRFAARLREERGAFDGTYDAQGCTRVIGGGDSPVLQYDREVIRSAIRYLSQPHNKPQLIVVGTYAPHFPYVAPPALYQEYLKEMDLPPLFHQTPPYMNPFLRARQKRVSEETARAARAAYLGMITWTDALVGEVRDAFRNFTRQRGSESLFVYASDHGDQVGERDIFGKCTFFETSARVPMILAGDGIGEGKIEHTPCSLMDLGPTLCEWAGVEQLDAVDGASVLERAPMDRPIFSEMIEKESGCNRFGLMIRQNQWKYMVYSGYQAQDILFDIEHDPGETADVRGRHPQVVQAFREMQKSRYNFAALEEKQRCHTRMAAWLQAWEQASGLTELERWRGNTAKELPVMHCGEEAVG